MKWLGAMVFLDSLWFRELLVAISAFGSAFVMVMMLCAREWRQVVPQHGSVQLSVAGIKSVGVSVCFSWLLGSCIELFILCPPCIVF